MNRTRRQAPVNGAFGQLETAGSGLQGGRLQVIQAGRPVDGRGRHSIRQKKEYSMKYLLASLIQTPTRKHGRAQ